MRDADFEPHKPPSYEPPPGAEAQDAIGGDEPFIMQADGRIWLYAPTGLADGPMPVHYEPEEAPTVLTREQILSEVASGALSPDEAQELLARL